MNATRVTPLVLMLLAASRPAEAHGDGLVIVVAITLAPLHILLFLPIVFLSGMDGRRWWAFGIYALLVPMLWWLQVQHWYHPVARFLDSIIALPPILPSDILIFSVLGLVAIYLVLRRKDMSIGLVFPVPLRNLAIGATFSVLATFVWGLVLFGPVLRPWIYSWPDGARAAFTTVWMTILPIALCIIAFRMFQNGRLWKKR